jgi:proteasome lid subunit RPN8/RPN11
VQDYYNTNLLDTEISTILVAYAVSEYPKEACGLIVNFKGKKLFRPCKNISANPTEDFIIDPIDQIRALKDSELLAVFHSHTTVDERPSDQDQLSCVKTGVPWIIYSIKTKGYHTIKPPRKDLPLFGREYVYGIYDCWNFICDLYKEELNIELPRHQETDAYWAKYKNTFIDKASEYGFTEVKDLKKYDVLLMNTGNTEYASHSAVYYDTNSIAHHGYNRLSCKEQYGSFWRKATSNVFRHRSFL